MGSHGSNDAGSHDAGVEKEIPASRTKALAIMATLTALVLFACAQDSTSPQGGETETIFDVQDDRVETFEDVDIRIEVHQGGGSVSMEHGEMVIDAPDGSEWTHEMDPMGDGYVAHAMFFQPGIHDLQFLGRRTGHFEEEVGEHMIEVHRQHRLIGDYWAELSIDPAPVVEGMEATVALHVFEFDGQVLGAPAGGLTVDAHLHDPGDVELPVSLVEADVGVYEATYIFDAAGLYELHITIGTDEGFFHFPVFTSLGDIGAGGHGHGGGGHHGMGR